MSEYVRAAPPSHGLLAAVTLLKRLFNTFEGHLAMQLWNGDPLRLGRAPPSNGSPPFTLVIRNPGAISAMVPGFDRLRFAEAYFRGDVDIDGDFFAGLGLKDHLDSIRLSWRDRLAVLLPALRLQALKKAWPQAIGHTSPSQGLAVNGHSRNENKAAKVASVGMFEQSRPPSPTGSSPCRRCVWMQQNMWWRCAGRRSTRSRISGSAPRESDCIRGHHRHSLGSADPGRLPEDKRASPRPIIHRPGAQGRARDAGAGRPECPQSGIGRPGSPASLDPLASSTEAWQENPAPIQVARTALNSTPSEAR